jgi:dTDP-4-amino-4,6-dideoxygalactose transaminase
MLGTDQLALHGGTPVRDVKRNPWPRWPATSEAQWRQQVEPAFRAVYESGHEGLRGEQARQFADAFARYCQTAHARLVVHGTDAIAAALSAALDLDAWGPGPQVIVPNYTFIASASAVLDRRCPVKFVDVDRQTFTLDPQAVEAAIEPGRTGAIMPVHLGGHPANMAAINAIAVRHGLKVIEDCAQAHGARCDGRMVGGLGDVAAFSFQSSKNLTSGEGGAVTTDHAEIDARVHAFMDVGRHPQGEQWQYPRLGWNYRPSEYVAALLHARLGSLEAQTEHRRVNADYLSDCLGQLPGVTPPATAPWCTRHAYHLYCMLVDSHGFAGRSRDQIVQALRAEGIPVVAGYTQPLADQQALRDLRQRYPQSHQVDPCPNTQWICDRSIWLPQSVLLAQRRDMDDIVEALAKVQRAFAAE